VFDIVKQLSEDSKDRHKIRAACELIAGMIRGAKHWKLSKQAAVWSWVEGILPSLLNDVTPDTQSVSLCINVLQANYLPFIFPEHQSR